MRFYLSSKGSTYEASPFAISVGDVNCNYRDDDAVPFVITLGDRVCFGAPGSEHHEILAHIGETQSKAEGRFWRGSNALAFWDENFDITNENVKLVVGALQKRLGINPDKIRMFLDCQYDSNRSGSSLFVELSPREYLSFNVPVGKNTQYFWDLYKKRNKLSDSGKNGIAQNGMYSRDIWRHYQNVSESTLRKIISESIVRILNELK